MNPCVYLSFRNYDSWMAYVCLRDYVHNMPSLPFTFIHDFILRYQGNESWPCKIKLMKSNSYLNDYKSIIIPRLHIIGRNK